MLDNQIYGKEDNEGHTDLVTFLANMTSSSRDIQENKMVFLQEIIRISHLTEWASCWNLFALANSLKINIHQFYPATSENMNAIPYKVLNGKINGTQMIDASIKNKYYLTKSPLRYKFYLFKNLNNN